MTRWIIGLLLMGLFFACDEGDGNNDTGSDGDADGDTDGDADGDSDADSDSDSDADTDGDFPGDCECAARFTFNGRQIDICSTVANYCACYIMSADSMYCGWQNTDETLSFHGFPWDVIEAGQSYSSSDSEWGIVSSIGVTIGGETFSGQFDITFSEWGGLGGVASGSFSARVSDDADQNFYDIPDGQFYAPVVEQ